MTTSEEAMNCEPEFWARIEAKGPIMAEIPMARVADCDGSSNVSDRRSSAMI